MVSEIICFSQNENARLFQSIGVKVYIIKDLDLLKNKLKEELNNNLKIIFYDEGLNDALHDLKEKFFDSVYPMFLSLPINGELTGKASNEMKKMIERTIGISGF